MVRGSEMGWGIGFFRKGSEHVMTALQNIEKLYGKKLAALDGEIGHIKDFYFDDEAWAIRYVVVDTGHWLTGRLVLLTPHAFAKLDQDEQTLQVRLSKKQIQDSPSIASHETVSRQFEEQYFRSYGWPIYWQGGQMWGMSGNPLALSPQPENIEVRKSLEPIADRHLQSTKGVVGYRVQAADGTLGHVRGFQVNPGSWAIEEMVVATGPWHLGKQIPISPSAIESINVPEKSILVKIILEALIKTMSSKIGK
jgi:hypothetical protein